ncbi:hypothetical protein LYSIN_01009 [Lysinibacillus sphaericus]|uniref:Uncharacterized protein n=1 Tax=Lysinibacillus sphaericus TaxID=1421 RepID=A0A2S5CZJ8_LYSSH|nr:hypothetical protein [Lysinibacillus sphaericus]POZ56226.1 hypothetical protein LYSIN_01009 [Lysinibacillus sphaericus]
MKIPNKFKQLVLEPLGVAAEPGAIMAIDILVDTVLGTFASGLYATKSSYQFKQLEKNIRVAIEELCNRIEKLEQYITDENKEIFENQLLPTFWDFVIEEKESEKIQLFVNGLESTLTKEQIDMEMMYVYFDTLKQMRIKDIMSFQDVFINKNYKMIFKHIEGEFGESAIFEGENIAYHSYLKSKLITLGLIVLAVIDGNGTIDEHYSVTELGKSLIKYFKKTEEDA